MKTTIQAINQTRSFGSLARRSHESGGTLIVAMVTIAVLALIAASTFQTVTSRSRSNFQTASWHDALTSAESGVNYALARLRAPLIQSGVLTSPLSVSGSLQSDLATIPSITTSTNGTVLTGLDGAVSYSSIQLPRLTLPHAGEGSSQFSAVVLVDAVPSTKISNSGDNSWYRIRSTGIVPLSGSASRVGVQKYDNFLRKLQFRRDDSGNILTQPQAVRTVEVIAKPVTVGSAALFGVTGIDLNNHNIVIDSYDSRDTQYSTNGIYDPTKTTKNANIVTDDNVTSKGTPGVINLSSTGAYIYGNVSTNNTPVVGSTGHVSGSITQDFYQYLPPAPNPSEVSPTWNTVPDSTTTFLTGTKSAPTRYKIGDTGSLSLTGSDGISVIAPVTGQGYMELWVPRDFTCTGNGGFNIPTNVHVTFYIDGDVKIAGNGLVNESHVPTNVVLYGNHDASVVQNMTVDGNGNFAGMIYAPSATVSAKGGGSKGDMFGSIYANNILFTGGTSLHYDQAQGDFGAVVDYRIASWYEDNALTR